VVNLIVRADDRFPGNDQERWMCAVVRKRVESLSAKYANPALDNLSDEELRSSIHEAATEWEKELDELFGANDKES
jgi:hypothetical protein